MFIQCQQTKPHFATQDEDGRWPCPKVNATYIQTTHLIMKKIMRKVTNTHVEYTIVFIYA